MWRTFVTPLLGADEHRPELDDLERRAHAPTPGLSVESRAGSVESDREREQGKTGASRTRSKSPATTTSKERFSTRELRPSRIGGSVTTGIPSTSSRIACEVKISKYRGTIETCTSGRRTVRTRSSISSWLATRRREQDPVDLELVNEPSDIVARPKHRTWNPFVVPVAVEEPDDLDPVLRVRRELAMDERGLRAARRRSSARRGCITRGKIQLRIEPRDERDENERR